MKRTIEGVRHETEVLSVGEIYSLSLLYRSVFLERIALWNEEFFRAVGCDLFVTHVLEPIALQMRNVEKLVQLRLVCKQWSELVYLVGHVKFGPGVSLSQLPVEKFKQLTSLYLHPLSLIDSSPLSTITKLTLYFKYSSNEKRKKVSLENWTSLTSLTLEMGYQYMRVMGLTALTRLTSLSCNNRYFTEPRDLFQLTQLQSLTIYHFPRYETLVDKLTNLTYLSAGSSENYVHFTGDGKMDTFNARDYSPVDEERMKTEFFYFTPDDRIIAKGKWKDGKFTGTAEFRSGQTSMWTGRWMVAEMIDGIIQGHAREDDGEKGCGTSGYWLNGKKIGCHTRFRWDRNDKSYNNPEITHYETWHAGVLINTEAVDFKINAISIGNGTTTTSLGKEIDY